MYSDAGTVCRQLQVQWLIRRVCNTHTHTEQIGLKPPSSMDACNTSCSAKLLNHTGNICRADYLSRWQVMHSCETL